MIYTPRWYQAEAIGRSVEFFNDPRPGNEIQVLPTASGKSLVIANMIKELGDEPTLILQPSKEILAQNYEKYLSYGYEASIYSASMKQKVISSSTFATIGSIVKKPELFKQFKHILIDECHSVSAKGGMYSDFLKAVGPHKVMGLTATPYRLSTSSFGSMLKFITRTRPRIFQDVNYVIQNKTLFDEGFLCPLEYYDMRPYLKFERDKIKLNSNGTEFDEDSMKAYMDSIHFMPFMIKCLDRLMEVRKSICVFMQFTDQAYEIASHYGDQAVVITAKTSDRERDESFRAWRAGEIKMLSNVGIAYMGVDYPGLDTVVLGSPSKSLSRVYQKIGRVMRIHPDKTTGFVVDFCGNIDKDVFGKIEDLHVGKDQRGLWQVSTNGRPLTNCILN